VTQSIAVRVPLVVVRGGRTVVHRVADFITVRVRTRIAGVAVAIAVRVRLVGVGDGDEVVVLVQHTVVVAVAGVPVAAAHHAAGGGVGVDDGEGLAIANGVRRVAAGPTLAGDRAALVVGEPAQRAASGAVGEGAV